MLQSIAPKLPMRNKSITRDYYVKQLGFQDIGSADFDGYLILAKDNIELQFFEFKDLNPKENYGQVYIRTEEIESVYEAFKAAGVAIHPNGPLEAKPWGQMEFSLLDPDHNLLTFGQSI
ncbi:MAG: VOC family protein [Salibacteraceae bacterium]|nr:VOC family protein [Salibacteraceae bacterium]